MEMPQPAQTEMPRPAQTVAEMPDRAGNGHDSSGIKGRCVTAAIYNYTKQLRSYAGRNSFMWFGQTPMLILMDLELIKDTLNRHLDFTKCHFFPTTEYIAPGVAGYDGEQWAKHRKILHPAFNFDKLKSLTPTFAQSCNKMINKWKNLLSSSDGTCEVSGGTRI
ncbi:hypothetical protein K1719_038505 [Acacia pycnantha]|nr:hypothetical protein K1719_038505 [Acacia pycnantha]